MEEVSSELPIARDYLAIAVAVGGALQAQGELEGRSQQAVELIAQAQQEGVATSVPELLGQLSLYGATPGDTILEQSTPVSEGAAVVAPATGATPESEVDETFRTIVVNLLERGGGKLNITDVVRAVSGQNKVEPPIFRGIVREVKRIAETGIMTYQGGGEYFDVTIPRAEVLVKAVEVTRKSPRASRDNLDRMITKALGPARPPIKSKQRGRHPSQYGRKK